jgi:predicted DNA-binding protein (UPF0251 family)
MAEAENHNVPVATNDSWRTWLMTGARRNPVDKRRMRGANKGLKKILLEGLTNGGDRPPTWTDFSGAMVRHAVDDAMRTLPKEDHQVVKLAYFGGYSNREIAAVVGLTEGTVQRRLRRALQAISEHVQHGRALGRRAVYALTVWFSGRWISDTLQQAVPVGVVAAATVIILVQPSPAAPAGDPGARTHSSAPSTTMTVVPPIPSPTAPVVVPSLDPATVPALPVDAPSVQVPTVKVPDLPPLPSPPVKIKDLL